MDKLPHVPKHLIDHFKKIFPNSIPKRKGITSEDIAFLQGQQSVIDRMEFLNEDEEET